MLAGLQLGSCSQLLVNLRYSDCHSELVLYKSSRILYSDPCVRTRGGRIGISAASQPSTRRLRGFDDGPAHLTYRAKLANAAGAAADAPARTHRLHLAAPRPSNRAVQPAASPGEHAGRAGAASGGREGAAARAHRRAVCTRRAASCGHRIAHRARRRPAAPGVAAASPGRSAVPAVPGEERHPVREAGSGRPRGTRGSLAERPPAAALLAHRFFHFKEHVDGYAPSCCAPRCSHSVAAARLVVAHWFGCLPDGTRVRADDPYDSDSAGGARIARIRHAQHS